MAEVFGAGGINNSRVANFGMGQVGPKQGIYEENSIQMAELGAAVRFTDGRTFRYAHFVAAVTVGKLVSQDVSVTGTGSLDAQISDSAGSAKDDYAVGDSQIYLYDTNTFTAAAAPANAYAGGYLSITDAAGEGYQYTIKKSSVGSLTAPILVELYDGLAADLDSETSFSIMGNPYRNLIIASTTDPLVSGLTARSMTIAYYGWVQTWGWGTVLADETAGTITKGVIAQLSDGVNGAAQPLGGGFVTYISSETLIVSDLTIAIPGQAAIAQPIIGEFGTPAVDTEYTPVYLKLAA